MRVIGAEVRTVGELLEALADTDPSTPIQWELGEIRDDEGFPLESDGVAAAVDASALTARIAIGSGW